MTRDLGLHGLIRRTTFILSVLYKSRRYWGPIQTWTSTGEYTNFELDDVFICLLLYDQNEVNYEQTKLISRHASIKIDQRIQQKTTEQLCNIDLKDNKNTS